MSIYDLKHMTSISYPDQTLRDRFDKLYKDYLEDKQQSDYIHYEIDSRRVKKEWYNYCLLKLKKITGIKTRIKDTEECILLLNGSNEEVMDQIRDKRYEESLADMSNYYSHFVSLDSYKYILQTVD